MAKEWDFGELRARQDAIHEHPERTHEQGADEETVDHSEQPLGGTVFDRERRDRAEDRPWWRYHGYRLPVLRVQEQCDAE